MHTHIGETRVLNGLPVTVELELCADGDGDLDIVSWRIAFVGENQIKYKRDGWIRNRIVKAGEERAMLARLSNDISL